MEGRAWHFGTIRAKINNVFLKDLKGVLRIIYEAGLCVNAYVEF